MESPFFRVVRPDSWESSRHLVQRLIRWAWRGQASAEWGLSTVLERAAMRFGCDLELCPNRERWTLRQFQRRAHQYVADPPSHERSLEWLALLQHHGGPTRLLDFSHSFYVAALFATENAESDSALWAVDLTALEQAAFERTGGDTARAPEETIDDVNRRHIAFAQKCIDAERRESCVVNVEPDRMNDRLAIQQGLFLFPGDIETSFQANLAASFDVDAGEFASAEETSYSATGQDALGPPWPVVMKMIIARGSHKRALDDLRRMNITYASLFPGLDGFGRSLHYFMRTFDEDEDTEREWQERE